MREWAGAQRPHCVKGRDPRTRASWRHFAVASCRGNRRRAVDRRLGKIDLRPCGRHSVHRQCAELPCCPSAAWYPPSYFSEDRRVPFLRCRRSFLCDSWDSLAQGHGLCLPLPRGKTFEKIFAERVRKLPGESHGHSVFAFFLARSFCTQKRTNFRVLCFSHGLSATSPTDIIFLFGTQLGLTVSREQIAWFTATCPVLFRRSTSSHRCSSWTR